VLPSVGVTRRRDAGDFGCSVSLPPCDYGADCQLLSVAVACHILAAALCLVSVCYLSVAGGTFRLELFLPDDYPMAPPKVRFLTRLYHPNIDRLGRICLDVIKKMWSPALQIRTVLLSIQALLAAPNPDDPLNNEAADLWKRDEAAALAKAREWTRQHASDASAS